MESNGVVCWDGRDLRCSRSWQVGWLVRSFAFFWELAKYTVDRCGQCVWGCTIATRSVFVAEDDGRTCKERIDESARCACVACFVSKAKGLTGADCCADWGGCRSWTFSQWSSCSDRAIAAASQDTASYRESIAVAAAVDTAVRRIGSWSSGIEGESSVSS